MPPKSNVPIRIGGSRTRSGCQTCKQRHLRCDEIRPICTHCQRSNRDCAYVPVPSAPEGRGESDRIPSRGCDARSRKQLQIQSISPGTYIGTNTIGAAEHFSLFTGKELAGAFSSRLWCDIIPRVAQHEPSIWHGIVAIGTLDVINRRDDTLTPNQLAMQHYSRAIQELHKRMGERTDALCRDAVLLSCIIFATFECMQGHYSSALRHISSGIKLLSEWRDTAQAATTYVERKIIQKVFLCLDCQAIQLGASDFKDLYTRPAIEDASQTSTLSSQSPIEDADLILTQIFHRLSHWGHWYDMAEPAEAPSEDWLLMERGQIQLQLHEWDKEFSDSLPSDQPATHVLLAQRNAIHALFGRTVDGPSEMEWDKYKPQFEKVVDHSEKYTQLTQLVQGTSQLSSKRPILTIGADIVLPLFLAGTRCRDPKVQSRALDLLRRCNRREGIWDSNYYAKGAERILQIEQKHAESNQSARWARCDNAFGDEEVVSGTVVFQESG